MTVHISYTNNRSTNGGLVTGLGGNGPHKNIHAANGETVCTDDYSRHERTDPGISEQSGRRRRTEKKGSTGTSLWTRMRKIFKSSSPETSVHSSFSAAKKKNSKAQSLVTSSSSQPGAGPSSPSHWPSRDTKETAQRGSASQGFSLCGGELYDGRDIHYLGMKNGVFTYDGEAERIGTMREDGTLDTVSLSLVFVLDS